METRVSKGFLIDKTRFKDNSLIIKILDKSGESFSGIYFSKKNASPQLNHLFEYEFVIKPSTKGDLMVFSELHATQFSQVKAYNLDQYYLIAELVKQILRDAAGIEFYTLLEEELVHFSKELSPSFYIEFLIRLIGVCGYLPDAPIQGRYFDLRECLFTDSTPLHPDFVMADKLISVFDFVNGNTPFLRVSGSTARVEMFSTLIRFLEIQRGIKISLNSMNVLRDIRQ